MDFSLLEKHPWATTGVIAVGGIALFLVFRRSSSSPAAAPSSGVVYSGVDPSVLAANNALSAQQAQVQGALSGAQIQGQTQIDLAGIGADVAKFTTSATQDVTNKQTSAQLDLGLGTIQGQVDLARINAGVQMASIDAIVSAFSGGNPTGHPATNPSPIVSTPVSNSQNSINQFTPPQSVTIQPPVYGTPTPGAVLPEGQQLVPSPTLTWQGAWPDANVVAHNSQLQVDWMNATLAAQANNNRNQCLANAERSKGYANYDSLVAACG